MSARVAIIDDSLTVRMDLGDAFQEAGFEPLLCASAAEARVALRSEAPDLIVLDVVLPDGDGVDLLAELRDVPHTSETPVILLSSEAEVRDRIRGITRGASAYVGKPYDAAYVVARAASLLRRGDRAADDPLTILLIDDYLTYREAIAERLRSAGYRTLGARSGVEGLQKAALYRPDAIIVDGVMPGMDGSAVIRKIRLDPTLRSTPCLMLTALEGAATEIRALDAGADAYVQKGEDTDVVLARLAAILRAAEPSRERAHAGVAGGVSRVLAVDDSVTYLERLAEELREDGHEVVKARSGEEALELLAVEEVDCILLDLVMPGLSGAESCQRIKASGGLRRIPLIIVTALDDPNAVVDGMNAGADDYVAKSAGFDVIKARVRAQLRRKHHEDESRRVRDEMVQKDAETRAARDTAEARARLLARVEEQNRELASLNRELQTFVYSVSHDLKQPLRSMEGFSQVLLDGYADQLDDKGRHYLQRVRAGAQRMGQLVDGLLSLSRVTQKQLSRAPLRIDVLAHRVIERLREPEPTRDVEVVIAEPIPAEGDEQLVESVLENLLGNAWKFTSGRSPARIRVATDARREVFSVADNGAGFDMAYADKLFAPFQRLHSDKEFSGTGIGLATTQRIVHRHGGRIWAEARPGRGATFYFTLRPEESSDQHV